jgi:hypothetical protein
MSAAANIRIEYIAVDEPLAVTLLELVEAVNDVTASDEEVVATVQHMLQSGRVRLCGSLRNAPISSFD